MRFFLFLSLIFSIPYATAIERVISLAPSSTELIYAAGLGDKLIAVSEFSDYPEAAQKLERVASFKSINIERIIALNPELIVAWRSNGKGKSLSQLQDLGFNIYYSDTDKLSDIAIRIEELSRYSNDPSIGQKNANQFKKRLKQLRAKYKQQKPINYFYQLSSKPIYTIAQSHWPSEVFGVCGGVNIFQNSPIPYPQVGLEQVLAKKPEVIFTSAHTIQNPELWTKWSEQLPAVKNGFVWSLNADWLNRPTPRSLNAIKQVCERFTSARNKIAE